MKKLFFFLLPMTASLAGMAQNMDPYQVKTFPASSITKVESTTSGGNIQVTGSDAGEAKLEVIVDKNWNKSLSKEEIERRLKDNYELRLEVSGGTLYATAKPNKRNMDWKNEGLSISFRMVVPHSVASKLTTSGGNITLSELSGNEEFTTSGGNLNLMRVKGTIKGTTSGGNITASEVMDDVDLVTSGGNVSAENGKGKIRLVTSGGSVHVRNLSGDVVATTSGGNIDGDHTEGELKASTSGGSVNLSHISGSVSAGTSGGNISVDIDQLGKYVNVSNSGGRVDLTINSNAGMDLDVSGEKITTSTLNGFSGNTSEGRLKGTIKGGGVPVTVHGGGRVNINIK